MSVCSRLKTYIDIIKNQKKLRNQNVIYDKSLFIEGSLFIENRDGYIKIGKNVHINSATIQDPIGGMSQTIIVCDPAGKIEIGDNVGISNAAIFSQNSILIEKNVMIGGSVKIYDTDFHSIHYLDRIKEVDLSIKSAPVVIKEGAFIGGHSIILKGVTVGKYSVIGAGSVVTKSVPDGEIWAGNPAKKIGVVDGE